MHHVKKKQKKKHPALTWVGVEGPLDLFSWQAGLLEPHLVWPFTEDQGVTGDPTRGELAKTPWLLGSRGHTNPSTTIRWRFMEGRWETTPKKQTTHIRRCNSDLMWTDLRNAAFVVDVRLPTHVPDLIPVSNLPEGSLQHPDHPRSSLHHRPPEIFLLSSLLLLTAFPFSGVVTANHRFPF